MSLLNFSAPYMATPSPLFYHHHTPQPPQLQTHPYTYPRPPTPFLHEDAANSNKQSANYHNHHQQQQQQHNHQHQPQQPHQDHRQNDRENHHRAGSSSHQQHHHHHHRPPVEYDDYYDDDVEDEVAYKQPEVTPIQGPIFLKNGTVPVVPLFSYPVINNGTFVQIPILWTALSVALGIEIHGEYIRGVPCIKTHGQLFCPTAGTSYPLDRIELFIDENKALMKRMYGEFTMGPEYGPGPPGDGGGGGGGGQGNRKQKRSVNKPGVPDIHADPGPNPTLDGGSMFGKVRAPRQSFRNNQSSESNRVDACESKVEIVTPYWASNSAGKLRAIVNTQHFEQAIHQEICSKARTNRCSGDCGCEQKYKWHRLLAYDPDNDCKGIFMDWFLFPSCCVCRCNPT